MDSFIVILMVVVVSIIMFAFGASMGEHYTVKRYQNCRELAPIERCVEHVGFERKK